MALRYQLDRIERAERLDPLASRLAAVAERLIPRGPVRDALHGRWLGHPLHPLLTDVAIGAWLSAGVLDVAGDERSDDAARKLVGLGVLAVAPTAAAGLADWVALGEFKKERRVGLVHAIANAAGGTCYALSWLARRSGNRKAGVALAMAGGGVVAFGGMLGGHLTYRQGVGVDKTRPDLTSKEWQRLVALTDVPEGGMVPARAGETGVLVHRSKGRVHVLTDTCTHMAGPLHEGEIAERDGEPCVSCPWHGSEFSLVDGRVLRGPSTAPQPAWDVRVVDGYVEARPHRYAAADGGVETPPPGEVRAAAEAAGETPVAPVT